MEVVLVVLIEKEYVICLVCELGKWESCYMYLFVDLDSIEEMLSEFEVINSSEV